jgi:hypothetical protein
VNFNGLPDVEIDAVDGGQPVEVHRQIADGQQVAVSLRTAARSVLTRPRGGQRMK